MSKPLVSCLWGCGESVNPPKLNIQEVQGASVLYSKGRPRPATHFPGFFTFCQITPLTIFYSVCLYKWTQESPRYNTSDFPAYDILLLPLPPSPSRVHHGLFLYALIRAIKVCQRDLCHRIKTEGLWATDDKVSSIGWGPCITHSHNLNPTEKTKRNTVNSHS